MGPNFCMNSKFQFQKIYIFPPEFPQPEDGLRFCTSRIIGYPSDLATFSSNMHSQDNEDDILTGNTSIVCLYTIHSVFFLL